MNSEPQAFEKYPFSTNLIINLVNLIVYAAGFYLIFQLGLIWALLYVIYILALEFSVMKMGCSCCYYYGKCCAFGRGKIAKILVKQKPAQNFCSRKVTWKNLLPNVLVTLIPVGVGVFLLISNFNWLILILTLIPILNWTIGSQLIYGKLVCLHCKQGRICCPANEFFGKKVEK